MDEDGFARFDDVAEQWTSVDPKAPRALRFWTAEFDVSERELRQLVAEVGPAVDDIVRALRR